MMKSFFYAILLSVFFVSTVSAFHGTGLICNKCHTMHASEDGTLPTMPDEPDGTPEGPNEYLLYKADVTYLCLVCHDGQEGTPDVLGDDINGLAERAAGYFATVDTLNPNGHNLAQDKIDSSGSGVCSACHWSSTPFNEVRVGCTNCHDPHGRDPDYTYTSNYRYRNLQWATNPGGEPIIKAFVKPGVTPIEAYEQSNIGYAAPTSGEDWREVTNMCFDCHHGFMRYSKTRSPANADGTCIRHPNTDSANGVWEPINKHTGATDPEHWAGGTGVGFSMNRLPFIVSGATDYSEATAVVQGVNAGKEEVFCLTCHKPHGSANSKSLRWDNENPSLGCQQCHNRGS